MARGVRHGKQRSDFLTGSNHVMSMRVELETISHSVGALVSCLRRAKRSQPSPPANFVANGACSGTEFEAATIQHARRLKGPAAGASQVVGHKSRVRSVALSTGSE